MSGNGVQTSGSLSTLCLLVCLYLCELVHVSWVFVLQIQVLELKVQKLWHKRGKNCSVKLCCEISH